MEVVFSDVCTDDEVTFLWEALAVLDVVAEDVGLDGWDYRPKPALEGCVWSAGAPDPRAALIAALERARDRTNEPADIDTILSGRAEARCGATMPRAGAVCIRRQGHPGSHRATR